MKSVVKWILMLWTLLPNQKTNCQTLQQWAQTVNWDGVSHWSKYIKTQAKYMGPNALPVPFLSNGSIDSNTYIGATGHFHFMKGDKAQNMALYGNYCVVKDVVSIDIAYVPVEFYSMSDAIKKERHVYYTHYNDKTAKGDVLLNVNLRLMKKWEKVIQLALRIGYRYPSSSDLETARFTDNMGYYFDLSFGKPISPQLKWVGMAGFYVWQMYSNNHRQNDALLFGSGLECNKNNWRIQVYGAGYLGYQYKSGDKPLVLRTHTEKRWKNTSFLLRLQQGVHDFRYSSAELGIKYFFRRKTPQIR